MTYPRAHLIDVDNGGYYHLISRCVRRAYLCGSDHDSNRNFDHRRQWIENRILELGNVFAVAVYGYAVMSNHYHVIVKVDPKQSDNWTDEEVLEKWVKLCPGSLKGAVDETMKNLHRANFLLDPGRVAIARARLGSLSWFMRFINEPLARYANREDQCTGRFWEGRFKSQALLDDAALLACLAYVDLNPLRAGIASNLADASHTSVKKRFNLHDPRAALTPLTQGAGEDKVFPITLEDYSSLLESMAIRPHQLRQRSHQETDKILRVFELDQNTFNNYYTMQHSHWQRALGSFERINDYVKFLGVRYLRVSKKNLNFGRSPLLTS